MKEKVFALTILSVNSLYLGIVAVDKTIPFDLLNWMGWNLIVAGFIGLFFLVMLLPGDDGDFNY